MKLRESGMPEENYWETLFNVGLILDRLKIDSSLNDVAELGCGYGTFTIPVAKRISGTIETIDIDPEMVERTRLRADREKLKNVHAYTSDILSKGFFAKDSSKDACLLFNILHCEERAKIFLEAARIVKPQGLIMVIHWRTDIETPRGPSVNIRPKPEQIIEWAQSTKHFQLKDAIIDLPPWHYGIQFKRV